MLHKALDDDVLDDDDDDDDDDDERNAMVNKNAIICPQIWIPTSSSRDNQYLLSSP
jgi:hypothetical protein